MILVTLGYKKSPASNQDHCSFYWFVCKCEDSLSGRFFLLQVKANLVFFFFLGWVKLTLHYVQVAYGYSVQNKWDSWSQDFCIEGKPSNMRNHKLILHLITLKFVIEASSIFIIGQMMLIDMPSNMHNEIG